MKWKVTAAAVLATALAGCGSGNQAQEGEAASTTATSAAAGDADEAQLNDADLSADYAQPIGVPECDAYLRKAAVCIEGKMPENMRQMARESMGVAREAFASTEDKGEAARLCQMSENDVRSTYSQYGCTF